MRTRVRGRTTVALIASAATVVSLQAIDTSAANASSHYGKVAVKTQRMSGASLKTHQYGWYPKGANLKLVCYLRGQSVKGYYSRWIPGGWDNLWYQTSDGKFVADVDINTGVNAPVTGKCGAAKPAPAPSAGRYNAAIVKKAAAVKENSYGGQCAIWVENIIRSAGGPSVFLGSSNGSGYQAAWAHYATRITSWSKARPGDIIQFYTASKGPHTAILMGGTSEAKAIVKESNLIVKGYPYGDQRVHTRALRIDVGWFGKGTYKIWRVR